MQHKLIWNKTQMIKSFIWVINYILGIAVLIFPISHQKAILETDKNEKKKGNKITAQSHKSKHRVTETEWITVSKKVLFFREVVTSAIKVVFQSLLHSPCTWVEDGNFLILVFYPRCSDHYAYMVSWSHCRKKTKQGDV